MSIVPQPPTPLATTDWVTGETTYDVSQMDAGQIWRSAVAIAAAKARKALPESLSRIEKAVALVLNNQVELLENGHAVVASQSKNGVTSYTIANGSCECADYERAPASLCKHRLARGLFIRAMELAKEFTSSAQRTVTLRAEDNGAVVQRCQEEHASVVPPLLPPAPGAVAAPEAPEPAPMIPTQFLVTIQGKQFVTFHGLLAMAHQQGLLSLKAEFISVTETLALARARAEFHDGCVFEECSDATPSNVNSRIKPHFARMSLTRAKCRALRNALNIAYVCAEELD